ncbi:PQQ-binding-like beta-propeller repeat protein [Streptomyces avermitilis]|uniref:hypothetical protein n=1 Tax=Streptomyces avermitilis TaxID=33903 RepID=UPI00369E5CFE
MTKRHIWYAAGAAALSLGFAAGCGTGDDTQGADATGSAKPRTSASATSTGPAYKGAALPALSRRPAWSLRADSSTGCAGDPARAAATSTVGDDPETCVLGDAVVVTQDLTKYSGSSSSGDEPDEYHFRARLYDAATGGVRASVDVEIPDSWPGKREHKPSAFLTVSQWTDGSPALLVVDGDVTEASGLKKESVETSYTMYSPSGRKLGSSSFQGAGRTDLTAEAGHVLLDEGSKSSTYAPIGGGDTVPVHNRAYGQQPIGSGFGYRVATGSDVWDTSGTWLVVSDRLTGKELWNTKDDVDVPADIASANDDDAKPVRIYPLSADKALLAWELSDDDPYDALLGVVDLKTGRTLAQGPKVAFGDVAGDGTADIALSPDGGTVVTRFGGGAVAWDVETGDELWRQEDDEQDITPLALPSADVLYASVGDMRLAALNMRTKKLLSPDLAPDVSLTEDGDALQFTTDGYGVLAGQHLFVFAPGSA